MGSGKWLCVAFGLAFAIPGFVFSSTGSAEPEQTSATARPFVADRYVGKKAKQQLEKDYKQACRKVLAKAFNLQQICGFEFEAPNTFLEAFGVIPSRFGDSNTELDAVFVVPATEASAAPVEPYPSADDWEVFMLGPGGWTDAHTQVWGSHTEPRLIVAEVSRPAGQLKAKLKQLKARLALFDHWRTRFQVVLVIVLNGPDQAFRKAQQDVQTSSFNVTIVHWKDQVVQSWKAEGIAEGKAQERDRLTRKAAKMGLQPEQLRQLFDEQGDEQSD
ncbi:HERC1 [Symbiodinium sp. CCMP2592]|nr:HERC1 [Symbiodinium sp. CCMP2592]